MTLSLLPVGNLLLNNHLIVSLQVFDHNQQNTRRAYTWADDTYEGVLKCPTCRVEIFLSRGEIDNLPNDHRIIQMIDFLSQVAVKSQNVCTKHERQPLNFFCKTCVVPVCRDCTVLDHKEQSSHVIVDVSQALTDNADDFNNIENRSKQLLQGMKTRSDALANASKQLDLLERQLRGTIKDAFIEYRLLLERRQEGLISILHDKIKAQKSLINARFVDVCTQGSKLQKLYDTFQQARPANDITKLFTVHNEIKEHEEEFSQQAGANDDELFIACEFKIENEPSFLAEMSCLGEVTEKKDLSLKNQVPVHQLVVLDMEERRAREQAEAPHPEECDDLMVTGVEPSVSDRRVSSSSRSRVRPPSERLGDRAERLNRYRSRELLSRSERDPERDVDETEDMDQDNTDILEPGAASSYLLRIASRLNATNANLAEAIFDLSADRDANSPDEEVVSSSGTRTGSAGSSRRTSNGPSPPRSRRSQNVRVVRHPQVRVTPDRSDRYIQTRYDRSSTEQR